MAMAIDSSTSSLSTLLDAIAAKQPTPGGGAVAAMSGALAAAIGEMVLNYSIGRKNSAMFDDELKAVLAELNRVRAIMLALMSEDQDAFTELQAAKKLDASDPTRSDRIAVGVNKCIDVPRSIGAAALQMLRVVEPIVEKANKWLLSDLAVCVDLAMATIRAAQHSVKVNLSEVTLDRRATLLAECAAQTHTGVDIVNRTMTRIDAALNA